MNAIPRPGRFEAVLAAAQAPANESTAPERYDLTATLDGYAIYDFGQRIATFEGPQLGLASKLLRSLKAEAAGVVS